MANYTFLDLIPSFSHQEHSKEGWGQLLFESKPLLNKSGAITMTHVVFAAVVLLIIVVLAAIARRAYSTREGELVPEDHFTVRNFFEGIFDVLYNMMENMMGRKYARQFFPLIGSLGIYILLSNLMGLLPGLMAPTSNLNTNLACGVVVFVFYNFVGLRENGVEYLKHFMGPMVALAWFIGPIELVGHAFRPLSLSIRLAGNLTGDHEVLGAFGSLAELVTGVPILLPIPFLFLGLLVAVVQTVVFCMLSSIYIALAVEHHDHGDHEEHH